VNKTEKLLALVYHEDSWRVDVRRSSNFQLREVVHHTTPILGVFFHNDVMFSLSNKLVASYPEDRLEPRLIYSSKKVLGWAHHPSEPYLIGVEADRYWIVDLNTLEVVKRAEWTEQIKWFNILRKFSNSNSLELRANNSTVAFSSDGNRFFFGGYGEVAVFDWHDMYRPRCLQPKPTEIISIHSGSYPAGGQEKGSNAHIIDMVPINRDRLLCATADGCKRLYKKQKSINLSKLARKNQWILI
jgi:WD40 repeat protein